LPVIYKNIGDNVRTYYIDKQTKGNNDIIDITSDIKNILTKTGLDDGILFLSVIGSTAGLTTMEYESGLATDTKKTFEKLFPYKDNYAHNLTWSDDNGHSHLRSTFIKTNFHVSVTAGALDLGTWQQVVLLDFDTRGRSRRVVVKVLEG
jgi:secondary thiamine-phosphate synthase enzyme